MIRALICLVTCAVAWAVILGTMWRVNPEFRTMINNKRIMYTLAVLGLFAFVATLVSSCKPRDAVGAYEAQQAAERPPCRDIELGKITGVCLAKIKAEPNVTKKNAMRAECLAAVEEWRLCQ